MSVSTSLFYLTSEYTLEDATVSEGAAGGTLTSGPSLYQSLGIESATALAIVPEDGVYFIANIAGAANNTATSDIYVETVGQTPSFSNPFATVTAAFTIDAAGDTGQVGITSLDADAQTNQLYFADGSNFEVSQFGADFSGTPTTKTLAKLPGPAQSMVVDRNDSAAYFAIVTGNVSTFYPLTGSYTYTHELQHSGSVNSNYIYKLSGVTPDASGNLAGSTLAVVPLNDGEIQAEALDTATDTLYFITTGAFGATSEHAGVYSISLSGDSSDINTIWSEAVGSGNSLTALANMVDITIDPETGDYYISTGPDGSQSAIYAGNVGDIGVAPTLMTAANQTPGGDGNAVPGALVIDTPPAITGISLFAIDGNQSAQGGTIGPADTATIAVTFSENVSVTSIPVFQLNNNGDAIYESGAGTDVLLFTYTPSGGQYDTNLATGTLDDLVADSFGDPVSNPSYTVSLGLAVDLVPPSITLTGTSAEAIEGGPAIKALAQNAEIHDPDGNFNLSGAAVTIADYQSGDLLMYDGETSGSFGSILTWVSGKGTLTFIGNGSANEFQALLGGVTYEDTGTDESTGAHPTRVQDYSVTETHNGITETSTLVSTTLVIDRAPVAAAGGYAAEVAENNEVTGNALTGDADPDGDQLTIASVSYNGATENPGTAVIGAYGTLEFSADGNFTYDATDTAAIDAAPAGAAPVDQFTLTIADPAGAATTEILAVTIDRPTTLSGAGAAATYAAGAQAVTIDPVISLYDPDDAMISGANVEISNGFLAGDILTFATQNGITGAYDQADGVLTLTGDASAADYQSALASVGFLFTGADPTDGGADTSRTITFTETDQSATGASVGSNVLSQVIDTEAPPVTVISAGLSLSDFTVPAGQTLVVFGTVAGVTVANGGTEIIADGGVDDGGTIMAGGAETVTSGGTVAITAPDTPGLAVLTGATELVATGVTVKHAEIGGGVTLDVEGKVGGTVLNGGTEIIGAGGVGSGTRIETGGTETVLAGGLVYLTRSGTIGVTVDSGGVEAVGGGLTLKDLAVSGGVTLHVRGKVVSTTVGSGGKEVVYKGGYDHAVTVSTGGMEFIYSAATVNGAIVGSGGLLTVYAGGTVTGGLTLSGGEAKIAGAMARGQRVNMAGAGSVLDLANPAGFGAAISGFGAGDAIDFTSLPYSAGASARFSEANNGTSGTLTLTDGATSQKLTLLGAYVTSNFYVTSDSSGGTIMKFST
jgi:VCBS repeat-containing protein/autotransporter passenger strand-loop-strand repeat protein